MIVGTIAFSSILTYPAGVIERISTRRRLVRECPAARRTVFINKTKIRQPREYLPGGRAAAVTLAHSDAQQIKDLPANVLVELI